MSIMELIRIQKTAPYLDLIQEKGSGYLLIHINYFELLNFSTAF